MTARHCRGTGGGRLGTAVALVAALAGSAGAANIGVTPTKLIVVDKQAASSSAKAVFVAKDGGISKGSSTDTTTISATLSIAYDNGADPAVNGQFSAGTGANWLVNKAAVAKYVNKTAPTGGGTKVVVVKEGSLVKLVGKNLGDTPLDILSQGGAETGTAHTAFCVDNGATSNCFCSTLAGCAWKDIAGGTGAKLVCKGGTPDAACATGVPPPTDVSHFWFYPAFTPGTVVPPTVTVQDQFIGPVAIDITPAGALMTPVDKNGEGIPNADDNLTVHSITTVLAAPASGVRISNQFGTQDVAMGTPTFFLVPTELFPGPTPLVPQLDHYVCYSSQSASPGSFPVTLADQFNSESATLGTVAAFCAPADRNGEGVLNDVTHLAIYVHEEGPLGTPPGTISIRNQFGPDSVTLDQNIAVAVPSTKVAVYTCGDDVVDPVEECDGAGGGCTLPAECSAQCTCEVPTPPGWTCDSDFYGTGDGCDCGCGIIDPDCADATVGSCEFCDDSGSCGASDCSNINPTDNSICLAPPAWTCNAAAYGGGDGCDCGCGAFDPDCPDELVGSCDTCNASGSCGTGTCPANIDPILNLTCTSAPPAWTCYGIYYGTADGCDCGCGVVDPDCANALVGNCEYCDDPGSCGTGDCPANINPTDNSMCTP